MAPAASVWQAATRPRGSHIKRRIIPALRATALALPAIALATIPVQADEVADFYKGKTFELLIGGSSGGGYDFYGRSLA